MHRFGYKFLIFTAILFALSQRSEIYADTIFKSRNTAIVWAVRIAQPAVVTRPCDNSVSAITAISSKIPVYGFFLPVSLFNS